MKVLEKKLMVKLDKIQRRIILQEIDPYVQETAMCDCTGQCYGDCQGDCQMTTEGDPNTTCVVYFNE